MLGDCIGGFVNFLPVVQTTTQDCFAKQLVQAKIHNYNCIVWSKFDYMNLSKPVARKKKPTVKS